MILYLSGKQRSGKDTLADVITGPGGFTKIALADGVKELATDLFGMKQKDRGLLIQLGQKMREIDPEVWLKLVWNKIRKLPRSQDVIIPDVRFPNEVEFLEARGAIGIRVIAPQEDRSQRSGYDPEFENDPTETALDGVAFDYYIVNGNSPFTFTNDNIKSAQTSFKCLVKRIKEENPD